MQYDIDTLHAILQVPAAFILWAIAIVLAMRWYAMVSPRHGPVETNPTITGLLSVYLVVLSVKQTYWQVYGFLRALDLFDASDDMSDTPYVAIVCNGLATIIGVVLIARVAYSVTGRNAYYIVPAVTGVAAGFWVLAIARGL